MLHQLSSTRRAVHCNPPRAPRLDLSEPASSSFDVYSRPASAATRNTAPARRWPKRVSNPPTVNYHAAPAIQPVHIVVTFASNDTLKFGNVADPAVQSNLRTAFGSEWRERVIQDAYSETEWIIKFRGRPWSDTGNLGILARRLICLIFTCLATQGWQYLSAVNSARGPTRHLFELSQADPGAHFFSISTSASKRKLFAVDIQPNMAESLIRHLRVYYGHGAIREHWSGNTFYLELLDSKLYNADEEVALLLGQILRATTEQGYRLDATVPLKSSGFFGFGKRREVWIFRRVGVMVDL